MIRNLGQVAAIYIGSSQPTNTNLIWLDNTVVPYAFRAYDGSTWSELATRDWVKMFVDGWLVSLPPSTQAGDTDYLLINSNNVNYKITVKGFVKSAVGNPLDFKGVIRTDADFPNPANCEAGDMYVIITSPAGGTVTDPYSGQMFEDTEKIVWDEVTKSWESLGKIQITVDLSTDYSATNVTINSSAGKGTTINAASTSLAGVMLPQQVKFLTYLSNGSTVPGDPSELDPDTPAHKHNYGDILDRLISQQETGDSTFHPMSQKATTDNLDLKFDKANVVQVQGASTVMVMSQKAVTDAITTLDEWIKNELTKYLPLSGGDMTGDITLGNNVYILGDNTSGRSLRIAGVNANNQVVIGSLEAPTYILSNSSDLIHSRNNVSYKILDSYNLPDPATLSGDNTWTGTNTFNGITNINNSFVLANSKALQGRNVAGTLNYAIGQVNANNNVEVGDTRVPLMLVSNDSNLIHYRGTTSYGIWDAYNLPDPAAKSADNVFTGTNSFTAGQFNVGPFEVTNLGSLSINMSNSSPWERYLIWSNNSAVTSRIMFGGYGNGDTANYAWIGIGDVNYTNAQYIFAPTNMQVPLVWSLDDAAGNSLVWTQSTQLAHFGRAIGTTKIRSGNVDLIHTKGATDYKILDESNYSQYLPTNNKWTYGFVTTYIEGSNADFNTLFAGPDSPKIVFNYYRPIGNNTNAPTGMSYGAVLQIDGNYNSVYNSVVLRPQLAFDVNHNVENGTRYMWFRTANNLGFGDSSNWKRVVTADENVAALSYDENTYPTIMRIDGTTYNWLRVPNQGLLPNTKATLDSGGTSYLGTNDWSFGYASIHTIYSKRYMFGNTGVDFRLDTNNKIAATISGSARGIEIGDLLVSSNYGEDAAKVPTNGIFASGIIKSYSGFSSDSRINNLNISKASNDALHISSFAGENVINKPGVDPVSGQSVGDGVALTYFWGGDYAFQLVGDIDGTGMAYRKYTPSTGNSTDWKFLADTKWVNTKLGGYLPLTGGILTGKLTINTSTVNPLAINDTNASATEVYIQIQRAGTALAAIGNMLSNGSYIYNYATDKYLFVGNDGCYFGTPGSNTKLLTSADLSGYLPLSGGTLTGALTMSSRRNNIVVDVVGGAGQSWNEGAGALSVQVPSDSGQTPLILARRSGATINTTTLSERLLDMALLDTGTIFRVGMSGVNALELEVTSFTNKVGIGKLFGKQIATTDQIPSIPSISISNSGSGNAVTSITASGHTLTVTKGATYLTSSSLSGYATQTWANGQFAPLSRFNTSTGYTTIKVTGQEFNFDSTNREIYMNYRTLSGSTAVTKITWKAGGGANSTALCEGRWGNLYMNDNLVATQSWVAEKFPNKTGAGASGTWGISISGNATTATTASKLGSTTIGGSAKPIYLSSGTPTACSATVGSATVPVYMNAGTITQCSTTLGVSITGNAATATNSTQLGGTAASSYVKANDNISRLTNDSGYTTQEWVNSQNFVKSTSTKKVADIQPVDALPATQVSGVLYLVFG